MESPYIHMTEWLEAIQNADEDRSLERSLSQWLKDDMGTRRQKARDKKAKEKVELESLRPKKKRRRPITQFMLPKGFYVSSKFALSPQLSYK